jgi:hypothetical protein
MDDAAMQATLVQVASSWRGEHAPTPRAVPTFHVRSHLGISRTPGRVRRPAELRWESDVRQYLTKLLWY